jgi:putative methyltransferase
VRKIAEWCGIHKIKYVFCADSNFGIFKRDLEIARYFVETKLRYDFPEKFRVCYAKNAEDTVFEIGKLLHGHSMEKSITMARQTNYPEAASNVGRKNIKMDLFNKLQKKYNDEEIPVYTELILGLPGETYESFLAGIEEILQSGIKNQAFVYFCQVYPNTELADEKYRERFKISTIRIPLNETHAAVRSQEIVPEYEDIIISTASMSVEDWKKMAVVSWIMQLFHGLKLGFYIMLYLSDQYHVKYTGFFEYIALLKMKSNRVVLLKKEVANFYAALDSILQGNSRTRNLHEFGDINWDQEEASYLNIICNKEDFYEEIYVVVREYLDAIGIKYDEEELKEVIDYQNLAIPHFKSEETIEHHFNYNIPEYFDTYFSEKPSGLTNIPQVLTSTDIRDYKEDKTVFAREVLLHGRKSNRMLRTVQWNNIDIKDALLLGSLR